MSAAETTIDRALLLAAVEPQIRYHAYHLRHFAHGPLEADDLASAARLAALEAMRRYDAAQGSFESFVRQRVRGAMLDELVRLHVISHNGPRVAAILSLDAPLETPDDDDLTMHDVLASREAGPAQIAELADLAAAVARLPGRLRRVMLDCLCDVPNHETAARLGLTRSRISQLRQQARRLVIGEEAMR